MANLTTSRDVKDYVLFHAHEPTDGSSDFNDQTVEEINRAYEELWRGGSAFGVDIDEKWWWLKREGSLTLEPRRTAGDVNVTNGSTTISLSSGLSTATLNLNDYFFKVNSHRDVFKLATGFTGTDTSLTLDSVYTGPTASDQSYRLFKLDYDLPSTVYKLIDPMIAYQDGPTKIYGISLGQLERDYPLSLMDSGTPTRYAQTGEKSIRFNKHGGTATTELIRVDYDYLIIPDALTTATTNIPLVPKQYRSVLADMSLHYVLELKGESTTADIAIRAKANVISMAKENRRRWAQTGLIGQIQPRQGDLDKVGGRVVLRTESGLIIG